jgi:hypothetical protein
MNLNVETFYRTSLQGFWHHTKSFLSIDSATPKKRSNKIGNLSGIVYCHIVVKINATLADVLSGDMLCRKYLKRKKAILSNL